MRFDFFPLRFEFAALEPVSFPAGKAANILRGALGMVLREMADGLAIFAPIAAEGPSGLADSPRPFVFRARHLDGRTFEAGSEFSFDVNLFSADGAVLSNLVEAFGMVAREGLGPGRGKAELLRVRRIAVGDHSEQIALNDLALEPVLLDLSPRACAPPKIRVEFLSPIELKHNGHLVERPEFPILFGRIRDRISTLRNLYGAGPLEMDFAESGARAAAVQMTRCEVQRVEAERRSSRTGQTHSIGGFIGFAEYEGDLRDFVPFLEAARWTGVGRQCVWGKGEIRVCEPDVAPTDL